MWKTSKSIIFNGLLTLIVYLALMGNNQVVVIAQTTELANLAKNKSFEHWSRGPNNPPDGQEAELQIYIVSTTDRATFYVDDVEIVKYAELKTTFPPSDTVKRATFTVAPIPEEGDYRDIQSAIDALPATGGIVYLKPGTYQVADNIRMPDNVTLQGSGRASIIKLKDEVFDFLPNKQAVIINKNFAGSPGNYNIILRDFVIDANRDNQPSLKEVVGGSTTARWVSTARVTSAQLPVIHV